jgi:large subunit ribosomal protein L10
MRRTRAQKEQLVSDYIEKLKKAKSVIFTSFSGLKTKSLFELKDKLFEKKIDFKVVKNSLLNLALKGEGINIPSEILDRPLALAFSSDDEVEPAKLIYDFAKENENLEILGGILDRNFADVEKIKSLAMLPSREELYFRLINTINAPKYRLLNVLTQNQIKLIYMLKAQISKFK